MRVRRAIINIFKVGQQTLASTILAHPDTLPERHCCTLGGVDILQSPRSSCWQLTFFKMLFLSISPPLRQSNICEKKYFFFLLDFSLNIGNVCKEEVGAEHSVFHSRHFRMDEGFWFPNYFSLLDWL